MDKLEDMDTAIGEDPVLLAVRDAVIAKLRDYYGRTDDARIYMITLGKWFALYVFNRLLD